jgi:hypothetical protein
MYATNTLGNFIDILAQHRFHFARFILQRMFLSQNSWINSSRNRSVSAEYHQMTRR